MFIILSSQFISYSRKNSFDILPLPLISWAWLGHIITQNYNPSIVSVWFSQPINYLIAYSVRYPVLIPFSVMLGYQFTLSTFIVPHPLDILALFPWLPFHLTYLEKLNLPSKSPLLLPCLHLCSWILLENRYPFWLDFL